MDALKIVCVYIVLVEIVAAIAFYFVFFRFENCYSYALREFRAGSKYISLRWSYARLNGRRVLHALVQDKEGEQMRHWQPHVWTDSPTLREWLHDRGYIKIGDE